jgi:hypothetical protein
VRARREFRPLSPWGCRGTLAVRASAQPLTNVPGFSFSGPNAPTLRGAVVVGALLAMLALPAPSPAANGDCGQPVSSGTGPTAVDCSSVLRSALGISSCELCVCDVNGSQSLNTADSLVCLKRAVGQNVDLDCPPCGDVTTTTVEQGTGESTTSTSTTSTTTTIPVRCTSGSDCSALPAEFRCNPHTETCEKPCTRNTDCHDFYLCNKTTQYCEDQALLF